MSGQLKEVRERIKSVNSTQQITKAMKMVSAAKLRRAQDAIVQMRPYAERLNHMLRNILSNLDGDASTSFGVSREVESAAVVVITSNRGLCGAFNSNIIKEAAKKIESEYSKQLASGKLTIICVGKKGFDYFRKRYPSANVVRDYVNIMADLTFEKVAELAQHLMDGYADQTYDAIAVSYGRFKNAALQFAELNQFLPVEKLDAQSTDTKSSRKADYIFEPDKNTLLEELIPTILQTTLHRYILDTHASEHGARMTAMENATENAEALINELKINYNKARQEAITRELSEIVGGAAALGG